MFTLHVRNVEHALWEGVKLLQEYGEKVAPRGLMTLEAPAPVVTEYDRPRERVLFNHIRDANPFFHFMESLWILAGRQDVEFLTKFNVRMADYSDDGVVFHAPYGYRLRHGADGYSEDQFKKVMDVLTKDPQSRQAVLQIWDHKFDLNARSKDIPCNDLIFIKIRDGRLNITVCNRSNDMIWGAYGANAVQFSVIQEYLAGMLGVQVGYYRQVSDSFHAYVDNPQWQALSDWADGIDNSKYLVSYDDLRVDPYQMVQYPEHFDHDLTFWFADPSAGKLCLNPFFREVAAPIYRCWKRHKMYKDGRHFVRDIAASDWRLACDNWLRKREQRRTP